MVMAVPLSMTMLCSWQECPSSPPVSSISFNITTKRPAHNDVVVSTYISSSSSSAWLEDGVIPLASNNAAKAK